MGLFDRFLKAQSPFVEDVDGKAPVDTQKNAKTDRKPTFFEGVIGDAPVDTQKKCSQNANVEDVVRAREEHFKKIGSQDKKDRKSLIYVRARVQHPQQMDVIRKWMAMPIICGGVECKKARLNLRGAGLTCGVDHKPIVFKRRCPLNLWQGVRVFAPRQSPTNRFI